MTPFTHRIVILGFGSVGQSAFRLLLSTLDCPRDQIQVYDKNEDHLSAFTRDGGLKECFHIYCVQESNWEEFLSSVLSPGDLFLDFSCHTKSQCFVRWCLEHGVLFLNTADSSWPDDLDWHSVHQHFLDYVALQKAYHSSEYPTALIEFGCNPGMVSLLSKALLRRLAPFSLRRSPCAFLAQKLGIERVTIVDVDDQEARGHNVGEGIFINTWSGDGLFDEASGNAEYSLGVKDKLSSIVGAPIAYEEDDRFLMVETPAFEVQERSYSPQGAFQGYLIPHEEQYSIARMLTLSSPKGSLLYKPRVRFVYQPCSLAVQSLALAKDKAYERPLNMVTLRPEEITSGSEYVGVLFENGRGEGFSLGNRVDPSFLKEKHPLDSATILQVSASAIAGILYLLHHPREGLLFPEDVDENEVLPMIEQTLGGFVQEKKWHFFLFH